ncbi:shikimate dehydrogenase [Scopulibacillus daqui]|uniref:Shikimate dehydrogenase (NADP(+)) n=1 Tax=Scopulibacillus daqui TaxID=1469162 RepID=A0ABS2Q293_9BACL|nr:shikimate dehydrogenase [Scopulibacillus daqui]MBM7645829.1 shikimate dehydrogenase [Scopulibacillus daqui]
MSELYAVIGDPIGHSLSPAMHQFWYKNNHMACHYHAFKVSADDLADAVKGLKAIGIKGFNVTIPHKINIMPLLDHIDEEAKMLGAVNTVVNRGGELYGYNTDGLGFLLSLEKEVPEILKQNPKVLIIGAGGAARAVGLTLAKHAELKQLDISNRTIDKAKRLSSECEPLTKTRALSLEEAKGRLPDYDLIINGTSLGMAPHTDQTPIAIMPSERRQVFVDLIYRPLKTAWLRQAEAEGHTVLNGLPMLIYQGALAFNHWFGFMPDTKGMQMFLERKLED